MSDYFQNELWDTGGDGKITITGDIYSTADPLSVFVDSPSVKSMEFFNGGINVIGEIQVNGVPIQTGGGNPFTEITLEKIADDTIFSTMSLSDVTIDYVDKVVWTLDDTDGLVIKKGQTVLQVLTKTLEFYTGGLDHSVILKENNKDITFTFDIEGDTLELQLDQQAGTASILTTQDLMINGSTVNLDGNVITISSPLININGWTTITKTTDFDVVNTSTLADDPELRFNTTANKLYAVKLFIIYSGSDATVDFLAALRVAAGTMTGRGQIIYWSSATPTLSVISTATATATSSFSAGTGSAREVLNIMEINYAFQATNSTMFSFAFANVTPASGATSRCVAGSTLSYRLLN